MTYPISIIGVGNMGGAMARNLLSKGWAVAVHDLDDAKVMDLKAYGALTVIDGTLDVPKSTATITCVVDAAQTRDVLFGDNGIAKAMPLGHTVLLCPTLAPFDVEQIANELTLQGLHTIDAPMSGGPARALDGTMSLMVACADHVFNRHKSLINALSSKVFRISEKPGDGARTKLVNNLLAGINLVGAAEVLAMAQKMGLDLAKTLNVIEQSSGQSWIGSDRMHRALAGDYAPRAHMTLLQKDTRLAVDAAHQAGFQGPLGIHARDAFSQASAGGLAHLDDAAVFKWLCDDA